MSILRAFFRLLTAGLVFSGIGALALFPVFLDQVSRKGSPAITPADAVVVLTGGSERIGDALELMDKGAGKRLFVSGVHRGVTLETLRRLWSGHDAVFTCCVDLDHRARNTRENMRETRDWVKAREVKSVILVTASYHMPRAMMEFSALMPRLALQAYPVVPDPARLSAWWQDPALTRILITEYGKWLLAHLRLTLIGFA